MLIKVLLSLWDKYSRLPNLTIISQAISHLPTWKFSHPRLWSPLIYKRHCHTVAKRMFNQTLVQPIKLWPILMFFAEMALLVFTEIYVSLVFNFQSHPAKEISLKKPWEVKPLKLLHVATTVGKFTFSNSHHLIHPGWLPRSWHLKPRGHPHFLQHGKWGPQEHSE